MAQLCEEPKVFNNLFEAFTFFLKLESLCLRESLLLHYDGNNTAIAASWYNERVVWNDKRLNLKLLRKGVLTRIYTPMAIVQGLRESGVFTSSIAAAQSLVNDKVSLKENNVQNKNHTKLEKVSRKFIRANSQASARKILHAVEPASHDSNVSAVPPLSPPSLDNHLLELS
uniref:Uncharacterized protein n=1 Tax=Oryza meridionalis TaxID=40149 RepID=A0A0E0F0Z4_9ORYZ